MKIRRLICGAAATSVVLGASAAAMTTVAAAKSKAPQVKIILLAETKGESSFAVPYYADGAAMAVEELGSKVSFTRIPAPLAPAAAQTALLQAIDQKPNVIIGMPSSAQVIALQPTIKSSGIPTLALSSGEQTVANGPSGAPNMFLIRPVDTNIAKAETEYVTDTLKAKKIGLQCVDNATGVNGCNAAKKVIATRKGVSIAVERTNSITATDLTEQATAMKNVDVVLDFNFPNPLGVMSNQLVSNGIDVPHVDGASAGIIANSGLVKDKAATNLRGVDDCVPAADSNKRVQKWVSDYTAKFGYAPIYSSAQTYDMIKFLALVASKVGSVSPSKMLKGIAATPYSGICADYKADVIHVLQHSADIVKFDASGKESVAKRITFPPGALPFTVVTTTTTVPPTTTTAAP